MLRPGNLAHVARAAAFLAITSASNAAPPEPPARFVATPVLTFQYDGPPALHMPTAVAIGPGGDVYVTDGALDRIVVFAPDGSLREEFQTVGEETLAQPISLKFDRQGILWIADTGHGRVLARNPDGSLARVIRCPPAPDARHSPDITDVAVNADGTRIWLADNDNHRLLRYDVAGATFSSTGERGQSLGQLYYPFMLALGPTGDVFVSEPVTGRVQIFDAAGRVVRSLGTYGADLGQFYRPKGIAIDADGNAWVVDGTLGVVQVFRPTGSLLGVLCEPGGQPLKLVSPAGIAFDADGNLYVAEVSAHRVHKFALKVDPDVAPPMLPRRTTVTPLQPQACAVCHLEWLEPLARGVTTAIMAPPTTTPEHPVASRPEMCLSCHDGAVVDSRRRIWLEHGHSTDILPPPTMQVPDFLPLVNGRIECRTCHSAHAAGQPMGDIATAVFLRVANRASELCMSCHADKTGGRAAGTHPTGGMPWAIPEALVQAGAQVGPDARELTCQVCHTPHGARHDHLLVMGTESSQLCVTCHDQMRPGMFRDGGPAEHPLSPVVNAEQAAAIRELGTQLGPGEHLICLSCHKLHHGKGERFLLADDLTDGQMCLRCHSDKQSVVATHHDLRTNFPEERNRLGMTAHTGGPCSSCHLFHRYARAPEASELDPGGGKCITCHQPERPAQTKILGSANHSPIGCTKCHDPHTGQFGQFMHDAPYVVCTQCHTDQAGLGGGPHDVTRASPSWPVASTAIGDRCLACHRPHGDDQTGRFRAGLAADAPVGEASCLACHRAVGPDAQAPLALLHPRDVTAQSTATEVPLSTGGERNERRELACRSCHDPHRGRGASEKLVRVAAGDSPQKACTNCHAEMTNLHAIGHAAGVLRAAGFEPGTCGPCHVPHGRRDDIEPRFLWPKKLEFVMDAADPLRVANQHCVACHHTGGPVAPPAIATHPPAEMFNATAPDASGYLPLFNERGEVDPQGKIACRTCHLTHGRQTAAPLPPALGEIASRELRARQWHIRSFTANAVCTTCHGTDALRRFMYFHDAARRGGPIAGGR